MSKFLKLLIYSIDTLDGRRGSSIPLQKKAIREYIKNNQDQLSSNLSSKIQKEIATQHIQHKFMLAMFFKYQHMRIKMKISYHAHMSNFSLIELWCKNILSSFRFFRDSDQIECDKKTSIESEFLFAEVLNNDLKTCIKMLHDFYD